MRADRAHSLRPTGQKSMHHFKEAEVHKSELTSVLELPIILGIHIFYGCQYFGRLGTQDRAAKHALSQDSWISKILPCRCFLTPLLPKLDSFREIHKVHSFLPVLGLKCRSAERPAGQGCSGQPPLLRVSSESVKNTDSNAFWIKS